MLESIKFLFIVMLIKSFFKLFFFKRCNFKIIMYLCTAFNERHFLLYFKADS